MQDDTAPENLLFKVIVVGVEPALQAGLVARVSHIESVHWMFSPLRLGLGVAKVTSSKFIATLTLWSFSLDDEHARKNYPKGCHAVIIVIRPSQIQDIPHILKRLNDPDPRLLVITLVCDTEPQQDIGILFEALGFQTQIHRNSRPADVLQQSALKGIGEIDSTTIPVFCVSEEECPPLEVNDCQQVRQSCSESAVRRIKALGYELGIETTNEECRVDLRDGKVTADFTTDENTDHLFLCGAHKHVPDHGD